ncbi:MAG: glycosyltransferase [Pseudomonadota bacterium]
MEIQSSPLVTILVTPRDRYSGTVKNLECLYRYTKIEYFELVLVDLGYPAAMRKEIEAFLSDKKNARIVSPGKLIPMASLRKLRDSVTSKYTVLIDNDSHVTEGWLEPLLKAAEETDAAVVSPIVLEKSGVDEGAELRNHLFSTELRVVEVGGNPYLIEYKTYRRALPEELPQGLSDTEAFELHGVLFRTEDLKSLEIPEMTIREHLDMGMQLKNKGRRMLVEPKSILLFDNLGTRSEFADLEFFNRRWNGKITKSSSDLFEKRWGYRFYSEDAMYYWAIRRRLFLLLRWMHLPVSVANKIDRLFGAIRRRIAPVWDPLSNPEAQSTSFYKKLGNKFPQQCSHDIVHN